MKNIKTLSFCIFFNLIGILPAIAGGPSLVAKNVTIHDIKFERYGIVMTVSGTCMAYLDNPNNRSSAQKVSFVMDKTMVAMRGFGYEQAIKFSKRKSYKTRILSLKGKTKSFQAWGTRLEIDGGSVSRIYAYDINILKPTKEEARFKWIDQDT